MKMMRKKTCGAQYGRFRILKAGRFGWCIAMNENQVQDEMQVCKAVIINPAGWYLVQLRDDIPTITYPGHWCLFGGAINPGEPKADGMRRELEEELGFRPALLTPIMRFDYAIPQHGVRLRQVAVYQALIDEAEIAGLELHEGAAMQFMTPTELMQQSKVVPWDLCMVMMHANVLPHPKLLSSAPSLD
jgi:8-oxo-dGTP diphosphatase